MEGAQTGELPRPACVFGFGSPSGLTFARKRLHSCGSSALPHHCPLPRPYRWWSRSFKNSTMAAHVFRARFHETSVARRRIYGSQARQLRPMLSIIPVSIRLGDDGRSMSEAYAGLFIAKRRHRHRHRHLGGHFACRSNVCLSYPQEDHSCSKGYRRRIRLTNLSRTNNSVLCYC